MQRTNITELVILIRTSFSQYSGDGFMNVQDLQQHMTSLVQPTVCYYNCC